MTRISTTQSLLLVAFLTAFASEVPNANNDQLQGRVVGGHKMTIEEVPYLVYINTDAHFCGGSIISATQVVTAAHCVHRYTRKADLVAIYAGITIMGITGGQIILVKEIFVHPKYKSVYNDYDIAVLKLRSALKFGKSVQPIGLPSARQTWPVGTKVLITGWGALTEDSNKRTNHLQGATINIVDNKFCKKVYKGDTDINSRMLCAGGKGKDTCQGDSGGPMAVNGVLGGVASFGIGCGSPGVPGVYANVAAYRGFIKKVTGL